MTMAHETTTIARTPLLLINYAVRHGADRNALMKEAGFSPEDLADPDSRVNTTANVRLWRALIRDQNDPQLSLNIAASLKAADLGLVGYAMYYSRDLRTALNRLALYMRIISEATLLRIEDHGEETVFVWHGHPLMMALEYPVIYAITLMITLVREITGADLAPISVELPIRKPDDVAPYRTFFRCALLFDRPVAKVTLSKQQMDLPLKAQDATLAGYLGDLASEKMRSLLTHDADVIATVRRLLWQLLPAGHPDLRRIASRMSMSERSLQRRLSEEGTSFSRILDDLRRDLSAEILSDRNLSVAQVAFLLGYSEPSAFQRAFRRWLGMSPRQFRAG